MASGTPSGTRPLAIVTGASSGMAGITPKEALAEQHRKMAQPGTAKN